MVHVDLVSRNLIVFAWWYITKFAFPLHNKRITEDKQELASVPHAWAG
jgi:hypothetical protein